MTVSPTVPFFILGREPNEASRMKHATGRPDACAWSTTRSSSDGVNRMSLAIERRSPLTTTIPRLLLVPDRRGRPPGHAVFARVVSPPHEVLGERSIRSPRYRYRARRND